AIYTGRHPGVRYPVVLGHEAAGIVEAVGTDSRIGVGTRVVIDPIIACGACDCCTRGDENLCRRAGLLGRELDGSLAEHVVLPERYLHPVPAAISLEPVPDFTTFPMYYKELTLVGSRALVPADFEPAIRLVAAGAVDLDGFITGSYPLHRAAAAFDDYERDPDRVLRTLIVP